MGGSSTAFLKAPAFPSLGLTTGPAGGAGERDRASAGNILERRDDRIFILMVLLTLGMTSTAAAVAHLFSSRYLMAAFPFALFALQPYFTPSRWAAARLAAGALCGYRSLAHYFNGVVPTG